MIYKKSELRVEESQLAGGKGICKKEHIIEGNDLKGRAKLFSKITLPVGSSVGMHEHVDNFEVYYIVKGKGLVLDSGEYVEVSVGDVIYTADGNKHSIENNGDEELEFIAVIINE